MDCITHDDIRHFAAMFAATYIPYAVYGVWQLASRVYDTRIAAPRRRAHQQAVLTAWKAGR